MKHALVAVVHLTAAFALTGCVGATAPPTVIPPTSSTSAPSTPSGTAVPDGPTDDASVLPVPEAGTDSRADAITTAEKVVTTFGQPALDAQTWMNNLYPLLTQTGAAA